MSDTAPRLRALVAEHLGLAQEPDRVTDDATFAELGADSIDTIELVMAAEDLFAVRLTDDDALEAFGLDKTFAEACGAIDAKRTEREAAR